MERQSAAVRVALRYFPTRSHEIEALIRRNENFSDMCEELAEVERVLDNIDHIPREDREVRMEECKEWIVRLTDEMSKALANNIVVPFRPQTRK
jgi:uncharacterized protein YdcH (DUF465 family)